MHGKTLALIVGLALLISRPVSSTTETRDQKPTLLELARRRFGKPDSERLSPSEEELFRKVAKGEVADYSSEWDEVNGPLSFMQWGEERVLSADRIAWLCTDPEASKLVTDKGIRVKGALIDGDLDLAHVRTLLPLMFNQCVFLGKIDLQYGDIVLLNLDGTHSKEITAWGLKVKQDVSLSEGFTAQGEVNLVGATIGGTLSCTGGQLTNHQGKALNAYELSVGKDVCLNDGFLAKGTVNLAAATIGGDLRCQAGRLINTGHVALDGKEMEVEGDIFMGYGFRARGRVDLTGASVGGDLECDGGEFLNPDGIALYADWLRVEGSVSLCEEPQELGKEQLWFSADGEVRLLGARVSGNFECDGGEFYNPDGIALYADRLCVEGSVLLHKPFVADGEVRLLDAMVGGNLEGDEGRFINPARLALDAKGLRVQGRASFKGAWVEGKVNLVGATVGGDLDCESALFIKPGEDVFALDAKAIKVRGDVCFEKGFKAEGKVNLFGAKIDGHFMWTGVDEPEKATLDLRCAEIGTLWDKHDSLPAKGNLLLNDLVYHGIHAGATTKATTHIAWLRLQPSGPALTENDILDWQGFCDKLESEKDKGSGLNEKIWSKLSRKAREAAEEIARENGNEKQRESIVRALNSLLKDRNFCQTADFGDSGPPEKAEALLECERRKLTRQEVKWLNRWLLEAAYPEGIAKGCHFSPQPYEHLAKVLRESGRNKDAKEILWAKEEDRRRFTKMGFVKARGHWLIGRVIGHGYRPWNAIWLGAALVVLGAAVFGLGSKGPESEKIVQPIKKDSYVSDGKKENRSHTRGYPKFNFFMYSVDVFLPLINLHQVEYYLPDPSKGKALHELKGLRWLKKLSSKCRLQTGGLCRCCLWFLTIMGWILMILFSVGMSGVLRR